MNKKIKLSSKIIFKKYKKTALKIVILICSLAFELWTSFMLKSTVNNRT